MKCFEQKNKSLEYTNFNELEKDLFKLDKIISTMYGKIRYGGIPDTDYEGAGKFVDKAMKDILLDVLKLVKEEYAIVDKKLDDEGI